jgi:hypothetical protein
MTATTYPAVIVVSRAPTAATPYPFVDIDDRLLHNDAQAAARLQLMQEWNRAMGCIGLYTHTLAPVADAQATAARIRADLDPPPSPLIQAAAILDDPATLSATLLYPSNGHRQRVELTTTAGRQPPINGDVAQAIADLARARRWPRVHLTYVRPGTFGP